MPASTTARVLTVEDDPIAEHHHIRLAIEAMLRENRTEREIVAAVRSMTGEPRPAGEQRAVRRRGVARLRDPFSRGARNG